MSRACPGELQIAGVNDDLLRRAECLFVAGDDDNGGDMCGLTLPPPLAVAPRHSGECRCGTWRYATVPLWHLAVRHGAAVACTCKKI